VSTIPIRRESGKNQAELAAYFHYSMNTGGLICNANAQESHYWLLAREARTKSARFRRELDNKTLTSSYNGRVEEMRSATRQLGLLHVPVCFDLW